MHVMRESWTDARLDDFRSDVDQRFERIEGELRELRAEMKAGFDSLNKTMINGILILSASYIAGFAALVGLVATQI
jgi:hypothetical protein